jgi:signal transduction histidine kinase
VARDIHDELGQVLTVLKMNLDWMERRISETEGDTTIRRVLDRVVASGEIVESAITGVQRIARICVLSHSRIWGCQRPWRRRRPDSKNAAA